MRKALAASLVLLTTASCGGSAGSPALPPDTLDHDASGDFVGNWYGTGGVASAGIDQSTAAEVQVAVTGRNALTFPNFCGDGNGPPARVTSDSTFTVGGYACPLPNGDCTIMLQIGGGTGTITGGTLSLSFTGTASGCGASDVPMTVSFTGTRTPASPSIASLSPASGAAGGPAFVLTVTGSAFDSDAVVLWNGSQRATTYVSPTSLEALILASDVAVAGSTLITVENVSAGTTSSAAAFDIAPSGGGSQSYPQVSAIAPTTAPAGTLPFVLTVTGTGFAADSVVEWNSTARATTFLSATILQAQLLQGDLASPGTAQVSVLNEYPFPYMSNYVPFQVTNPASIMIISLAANDMVWDPLRQVIYLSVPNSSSTNPNTITVLDPYAGALTGSAFAGSQPNRLAISDDGQFLYAGIDGAASVQRFLLPGLTPDISIGLGSDPFFGPYVAEDLQVAPGSPHTIALPLANPGFDPEEQGGVVIFDDAVARPTKAPGFGGTGDLFDSLQWGATTTELYAANDSDTGFDFYTLSVSSAGVTLLHDYASVFSSFSNRIHFDRGTQLIYSDGGQVVDPATGSPVGTFSATGVMVPDSSLNAAFFVNPGPVVSATVQTVQSFDLTHFTPIGAVGIAAGPAKRVIRWGSDGLAFLTSAGEVVLLHLSSLSP